MRCGDAEITIVQHRVGGDALLSDVRLQLVPAQQQARVVATKAETIRDDSVDSDLARDMWYIVEVALCVGVVEVNGRWEDAGVDRQCRRDQLDAA